MNKKIADRWIEALESGKFPRIVGRLKSDRGYCCLGVLAEVQNAEFKETWNGYSLGGSASHLGHWKDNPLASTCGTYVEGGREVTLTHDNDSGKSFVEIAAIIRKHWREL